MIFLREHGHCKKCGKPYKSQRFIDTLYPDTLCYSCGRSWAIEACIEKEKREKENKK